MESEMNQSVSGSAGLHRDERDRAPTAAAPPHSPPWNDKPVDRRIVRQVIVLAVVALVLLGFVVWQVVRDTLGPGWAVGGLLVGSAVGIVASRTKRLQWDERTGRVISRIDRIGAVLLVAFLLSIIIRSWVLGHWVEGAALSALGLSITAGTLAGQALATRRGVREVLNSAGRVGSTGHGDR
jgi:hypothetical protein